MAARHDTAHHISSVSVHEHRLPPHTAADFELLVAEGLTIDISVYHSIDGQHRKGEGEMVCALSRCTERKARFDGSAKPGKLAFVLDNRFSWMKAKDVSISVRESSTSTGAVTGAA
jgi:hypothetical protein